MRLIWSVIGKWENKTTEAPSAVKFWALCETSARTLPCYDQETIDTYPCLKDWHDDSISSAVTMPEHEAGHADDILQSYTSYPVDDEPVFLQWMGNITITIATILTFIDVYEEEKQRSITCIVILTAGNSLIFTIGVFIHLIWVNKRKSPLESARQLFDL